MDMEQAEVKLLPCPFCGGIFDPEADVPTVVYNFGPHHVTCMNCIDDCMGLSVKRWNSRTFNSRVVAEWQPIETAPKDGTPILIYAEDLLHGFTNGCAVARWTLDSANDARFPWWRIDEGKFGPFDLRGPSPTHWMPLPEPPTVEAIIDKHLKGS